MRIDNIGPDDIQVGDVMSDLDESAVVTHVLEPGWVVVSWGRSRVVLGWVKDAWRLHGDSENYPRSACRDVPDKWERLSLNRVAPVGGAWAFMVDYLVDMLGPNQAWANDVAAQTAQWLTDRLNEGHFGEMPTGDDGAV